MSRKSKKKEKSAAAKMMADIKEYRLTIIVTFLILAVSKLMLSIAPKVSGDITDYLAQLLNGGRQDTNYFLLSCGILALLYFVGYGSDTFVNRNLVSIFEGFSYSLRNRGQKKLNRLSINYLDTHPEGDVVARLTADIQTFVNNMETTVPGLVGQSVLLIGVAACMLVTNWKLTLIYLVLLPFNLCLTLWIAGKGRKLTGLQRDAVGGLSEITSDTLQNHLVTKVYRCEEEKVNEFMEQNEEFFRTFYKSRFVTGFVIPLSNVISNFAYIALCVIGAKLIIDNNLTIGEFQAFVFYGYMLQQPLLTVASSVNQIQGGLASLNRVYEFFDAEEMPEEYASEVINAGEVTGKIEFTHVEFGYVPERVLMKDVSFAIEPGMKVAIVGPSGAGKTTLVNLLMRFYEINGGRITLEGRDISQVSRDNLREAFGMVLQETWIFEGTVAENIGYGKIGATREEIINAAKLVGCDSFIEKLSDGYDALIGGENSSLSEGEKQLITIARTVLSDPKVLILDEATSRVDTKTEALLTTAMENLMKNRTSFVIAHRLYTIRNSDLILYMENGDVLETGSHEELMSLGGRYASMYNEV
ncbi:MAG: ABC transporter ATP-binding protein [Mogibacterium sp.]|nr:ABC transporter ATP-binding protein [Mogibacterium sp.]